MVALEKVQFSCLIPHATVVDTGLYYNYSSGFLFNCVFTFE